jgi:hypothetical protein
MTPEQREELKAAALSLCDADESNDTISAKAYATMGEAFFERATPTAILSLIAQVEALTVPPGWKLVPLEPNQEMCEEGYYEFDPDGQPDAANLWRAMVKAAPTIPAIPGTKEAES